MPRQGIMLAKKFEDRYLDKWPTPFLAQPKLDGMRCLAAVHPEYGVNLISSQGNEIVGLPELKAELYIFARDWGIAAIFDGELFSTELTHEEIVGICKRKAKLSEYRGRVKYNIFDLKDPASPQSNRAMALEKLKVLFEDMSAEYVTVLDTYELCNLEQVYEMLDVFLENGYEGIILRNPKAYYQEKRTSDLLKIKPTLQGMYDVIGYNEEISIHGEPKGCLGSLECVTPAGDKFCVGSGFTREQREELWPLAKRGDLLHAKVQVKFQNLTAKGVPRFPIFVKLVGME